MRSLLRASCVVSRFGSPPSSVLNIVPCMKQSPSGICQVSVKVLASLVSADDLSYIRGIAHSKPSISGGDVAGSSAVGIVTEVGEDVHNLSSGDHVLLVGNRGCWADSVLAYADDVMKLPGALSNPSQAAVLPLLLSARAILQLPGGEGRLGDVLLAKDLDPALALALEAVGKYYGVKVTRDVATTRGASLAVSSRGGRAATDVLRRLGPRGELVVVPAAQMEDHSTSVSFPIAKAIFAGVSVRGFSLPGWVGDQRNRADELLRELWHAVDEGKLAVPSLETFQLNSIHRAVNAAEVSGASIVLMADS